MIPLDIFKFVGSNPKEFVINQVKSNSNPMLKNLINMAENGDEKGLEKFARNMCNERGINYDETLAKIKNNIKR